MKAWDRQRSKEKREMVELAAAEREDMVKVGTGIFDASLSRPDGMRSSPIILILFCAWLAGFQEAVEQRHDRFERPFP